ncbi:MAG: hypothetical protein K2K97_07600, partial [Muribaculaceae bacterium]|nr:hypothetical protein [Muribaculaceae bacterium]
MVSDGYEDERGDWHPGEEEWSDPIECNAVHSGSANDISFKKGTTSTYSYVIGRLDPDCREFKIGER